MKPAYFEFYGHKVKVESEASDLLVLLKKDFSVFVKSEEVIPDFSLQIFLNDPPLEQIPNIVCTMQTINSICYDIHDVRYCDYYGDLMVVLNKKTNSAKMYSKNLSKIHEVSYLLILSRIGKRMDLGGLHKLHAFSVAYKDLALVCMMPMKGGKSTLLMEFLKDSRFKIISDDIPLVDWQGHIRPFPIKIGLSDKAVELKVLNPDENYYFMDRGQYGKKKLLSLKGLPGKVVELEKSYEKVLLIEAFRYNSRTSILKDSSFLSTGKGLLKHGVIGFGLPMVIEYFWENGWRDFLTKTKIFCFRCIGFGALLFRAKRMKLFLGRNPEEAAEVIMKYIAANYEKI